MSEDEAPALARELRALSAAAPRFSVVRTAAHFIFELRPQFRSGILDSALLGLILLESSMLKFEVRAT